MWHLNLLSHLEYSLLQVTKLQRNSERLFFLQKGEGHFENYVDLSMLFLQHLNWNLLAFSNFDFEHYLWKKYCKGFQNSKIINSIKTDFSEYFPSPCVFQFSVYIHSLHSQEYSYFHETQICLNGETNFIGQICRTEIILHEGTNDQIHRKWGVGA